MHCTGESVCHCSGPTRCSTSRYSIWFDMAKYLNIGIGFHYRNGTNLKGWWAIGTAGCLQWDRWSHFRINHFKYKISIVLWWIPNQNRKQWFLSEPWKTESEVFWSHMSGFNEGNFSQVVLRMQLIRNGWHTNLRVQSVLRLVNSQKR